MTDFWLEALILGVASAVQSAVGFAMAMLSVPLLVAIGRPLPVAVAIVMATSIISSLVGVFQLRRLVDWKWVGHASALRLATIPLGIFSLGLLSSRNQGEIKLFLGLMVLASVAFVGLTRPKPEKAERWTVPACLSSGYLQGLVGMGGPPLVLWVMSMKWSARRTRAFLFGLYVVCVPLNLVGLYLVFGGPIGLAVVSGLLASPATILGSLAGLKIGQSLPKPRLRVVAFVLLVMIGLKSTLSALSL
ncbi:MAG: sulfite exporter TauE/SafE family protein [Vulcanimicrobiota bacterium]